MAKLMAYFNQPVLLKWVVVAYVGLIAVFAYSSILAENGRKDLRAESIGRATQLCQVVDAVHKNAKLRVRSDRDELKNSREILKLSDRPLVRVILKERVKSARDRVRTGENGVRATALPPICKLYLKEK